MRLPLRSLLGALVGLFLLLGFPSAAQAASNDAVDQLDITIELDEQGRAHVTETYAWDFGTREGLGFTRVLAATFDYDPAPDKARVYEYSDFDVTSATDAPADVWPREDGAWLRVDVGAADGSNDRRSGVQEYTLTYTIDGALNAVRDQDGVSDQDELYWNATGNDWEVPIRAVNVTVTGPTDVVDMACYSGPTGDDTPCPQYDSTGNEVTGSATDLQPGAGLTIMAAYPPGTFTDTDPILVDAAELDGDPLASVSRPVLSFLGTHWPWLAPLALAAPVGLGFWLRHRARDLHFMGVPPGVIPPSADAVRVTPLSSDPAVAVRFTVPDGLRPAEVGVVRNREGRPDLISATIIDLAVRGYLTIEETTSGSLFKSEDWLLRATPQNAPQEELRSYEAHLLASLFRGRMAVQLSKLRNTFASTMKQALDLLKRGIMQAGLFTRNVPVTTRASGKGFQRVKPFLIGAGFAAVAGTVLLQPGVSEGVTPTGLLGIIVVAWLACFGIAVFVTRKARRQRSAVGRALYEQTRGFETYLSTAEANQIRFEEGEDIFSRYLPYAMVFGVADRWAQVFEQLRAQGMYHHTPVWYVGATPGYTSFSRMGSSMNNFGTTAATTLTSTPGSSGGSGSFGGGGGFSGGGGGGGGGGGR